jgi:hypothetical protein
MLLISAIRRQDLGATFTCQAVNNNQSVPVATTLKLDLTCEFKLLYVIIEFYMFRALCQHFCSCLYQGCQMVCFQTKNYNLGKFWRALQWKMLVYFMII